MLLGYCRVSTSGQSLALQRRALAEAGVERIFEDRVSGRDESRPGLTAALRAARPGDVLVVWSLDRLGRSVSGLSATLRRLEERGVGLRAIQQPLDTSSPSGRFVVHLFGTLAEYETGMIGARTRAGREAARAHRL